MDYNRYTSQQSPKSKRTRDYDISRDGQRIYDDNHHHHDTDVDGYSYSPVGQQQQRTTKTKQQRVQFRNPVIVELRDMDMYGNHPQPQQQQQRQNQEDINSALQSIMNSLRAEPNNIGSLIKDETDKTNSLQLLASAMLFDICKGKHEDITVGDINAPSDDDTCISIRLLDVVSEIDMSKLNRFYEQNKIFIKDMILKWPQSSSDTSTLPSLHNTDFNVIISNGSRMINSLFHKVSNAMRGGRSNNNNNNSAPLIHGEDPDDMRSKGFTIDCHLWRSRHILNMLHQRTSTTVSPAALLNNNNSNPSIVHRNCMFDSVVALYEKHPAVSPLLPKNWNDDKTIMGEIVSSVYSMAAEQSVYMPSLQCSLSIDSKGKCYSIKIANVETLSFQSLKHLTEKHNKKIKSVNMKASTDVLEPNSIVLDVIYDCSQ